jgi:GntR family transcriptional regulator/MocR family aminotransferase
MVLPPSLLSIYQDKVGFFSCSVPVTEQLLLTELLQSGEFIRHLRRIRRKVRAKKG